jgi:hypothetical protein
MVVQEAGANKTRGAAWRSTGNCGLRLPVVRVVPRRSKLKQ